MDRLITQFDAAITSESERERKMLKVIEIELANIKLLAFIDETLQLILAHNCLDGIFVISCNFV